MFTNAYIYQFSKARLRNPEIFTASLSLFRAETEKSILTNFNNLLGISGVLYSNKTLITLS